MTRVLAVGATDTGQVRPANEDSYFVGECVFAVADGMGGHLAGEIASATALEPVERLDGRVFPDGVEAVSALRDAVEGANAQVSRMAADEPSYRGMGTTLTAAMVEGRRLHVAHVGDSRAYLRRSGVFSQITDDHTLVQHLVDEGQITVEEAATHPQRSIITRAIGVSGEVEVDSMTIELEVGDQVLLCSDGLTGVVGDREIAQTLADAPSPQAAVDELIAQANRSGGPDNITVVLLQVVGDGAPSDDGSAVGAGAAAAGAGAAVGAASDGGGGALTAGPGGGGTAPSPGDDAREETSRATQPVVVRSRDDRDSDWRDGISDMSAAAPADEDKRGIRWGRVAAITLGLLVILAVAAGIGLLLLSQTYSLGLDDDEIVIYQGLDAEVGPIELSRLVERTGVPADELPPWYRDSLRDRVPAASLADARQLARNAPRVDGAEDDAADDGPESGSSGTDGTGTDDAGDDGGTGGAGTDAAS